MIDTDGKPTIASKRSDRWLERALEAGGHLGDDVAAALLEDERREAADPNLEPGCCGQCGPKGCGDIDPFEQD